MKTPALLTAAALTLATLSACNNNTTPPFFGLFRLVDGIPDSSSISASATSDFPSTGTASFDQASSIVDVPEGGYNVQVENGNSTAFTVNNVSIDHNNWTTLFTYGSIGSHTANGFTAEVNLGQPPSGDFTLQVANDSTQSSALNVFLIPVGGSITGTMPVAPNLAKATADSGTSVPAGTYEIIVTSGGSIVYDSGHTHGILFPPVNSNVVQLGFLDTTSAQATAHNGAPLAAILLNNSGGETLYFDGST